MSRYDPPGMGMRMLAYVGLSALVGATLFALIKASGQWGVTTVVVGGFLLGALWMSGHRWWVDNKRH